MPRNLPPGPILRRRVAFLEPKVEIVIACEGRNTEPGYFQDCVRAYGAGLVRLRVVPETGVPVTVVRAAIVERESLLARLRKLPAEERHAFRVWAVFDKDDHDVEPAIALAHENKIDIAFSNPCFEIWPVLHLVDYGSQDDRRALQRFLQTIMPKYDHNSGALIDFDLIKDRVDIAIARARRLEEAREAEGNPLGTPCTSVHKLVKKVLENGRITYRRAVANMGA